MAYIDFNAKYVEYKEGDPKPNTNDINQYILGEKLGEGIFGTVKLGIHKITKEKVAIKILNKNRITKKDNKCYL